MKLDISKVIVGCCGVICTKCESFLSGDCNGCRQPGVNNNCQIMECCLAKGYSNCAECNESACEKLGACAQDVKRIKEIGIEAYIKESYENQ